MSDALELIATSESSGGPGAPTITSSLMKPTEFAAAPLASGVPTVMFVDGCTGGLHDGNASGGPCVRFGAVQATYAGTIDTRNGVAPLGRGCVAWAAVAMIITATAPKAT